MKKVLILAYHFTQKSNIGAIRLQGLAKYLYDFGWEPTILTAELQSLSGAPTDLRVRVIETSYDDLLITWKKKLRLKSDKTVKAQFGWTSYKNKMGISDFILNCWEEIFAYPDGNKGWYKFAIEAGGKLLQEESYDAIISSSSPATAHLIAREFKNKYGIPWIADLRDLWTQNHYYSYTPFRKYIERRLEVKTLSAADWLVTVSKPLAEKLKILHKEKDVYAIPNGFDPQEINNSLVDITTKFTITYTGSLYQGKRDPAKLFEALRDLISDGTVNQNNIAINFYGPNEDWMQEEIESYGLHGIVKVYGIIPRKVALDRQRESQLLLLLLWDHPEEIGVYTAKIFEYLAAQRPILAIGGPKGVVNDLLGDTNAGVYATSVENVKKALEKFYSEYKLSGNVNYKGERTKIDKYSQKEMARKFAEALDTLTRR